MGVDNFNFDDYKFAPEVANLPLHSAEEMADLEQSMRDNGFIREYPVIAHDGLIYDGRNRYLSAKNTGTRPVINNVGSKRYALQLAESSYLQRVYTLEQKIQVKAHFANLKDGHRPMSKTSSEPNSSIEMTTAQLAKDVGVSESKMKKVVAIKNAVEDGKVDGEVRNRVLRGDDTNNAAYEAISIADKAAKAMVGDDEDPEKVKILSRQITEDAAELANTEDISILNAVKRITNTKTTVNGHTLGENDSEWYTPIEITNKAHIVMGSIDIDPASNDYAQGRIKAKVYYTEANSSLVHDWHGNVWMNPPYGKDTEDKDGCATFINYLLEQAKAGNVEQYLVLVNTSNGTDWYTNIMEHCTSFGLSRKRIQFDRHPDSVVQKKDQNTKGQTLFYFGENTTAFYEQYDDLFSMAIPINYSTALLYE